MSKRTDIKMANVFISWTGRDRELKNTVVNYLEENGITCLESDESCCGDFGQWSREAVSACSLFLLIFTENTKNSTYVPIEIEEFKKLDDWQNRFIPVCSNMSLYQEDEWGLHDSVSAVFTDGEDYLPTLLEKTKSLLIHRQHSIYRTNSLNEYISLIPLIGGVRAATRQYSYDDLYVMRSLTEIDENGQENEAPSPGELIRDDGILFISGPAGSGKTQYIHQIKGCADEDSLVISLSSAKVSSREDDLLVLIYNEFRRIIGAKSFYSLDNFKSLIDNTHLVLILDGMDEIATRAATDKFIKKIEGFYSSNHSDVTLIFTSRNPEDADTIALMGRGPRKFVINRLNDSEIKTLGENLFLLFGSAERNNEFYVNVRALDNEIKGNPLLLSQLAIVYEKTGEIPQNIVGIYDAISKITLKLDERADFDAIPEGYGNMLTAELPSILKSFSKERYILLSEGKEIEAVKILSKLLSANYKDESSHRAEFLVEYLENRSILIDGEFYHKMFLEYFTAVAYYEEIFDDYDRLADADTLYELISHYGDSYWSSVINLFLVKADSCIDGDETEELYRNILEVGAICEYTLLFDTCRDLIRHKERAELVLVLDILVKSTSGVYPPYGPLFWYVPEYDLYETAAIAADKLAGNAGALALVRDVCCVFGKCYTLPSLTDKIDSEKLFRAAESSLFGVRRALVELFCLGHSDSELGTDIYPRCFNTAEARSFMEHGRGVFGTMATPFDDELGLWQGESYPTLSDEYIGFVCCPYDKEAAEESLAELPTAKVSAIAFTNTDNTTMGYVHFTRTSVRMMYIPENTAQTDDDYARFTRIETSAVVTDPILHHHVYIPDDVQKITVPEGVTELAPYVFAYFDALEEVSLPEGLLSIGEGAFNKCTALARINIPDSVEKIGRFAFQYCTSLAKIDLPNSVREIGWSAFNGCTALTKVVIPDSLEEISNSIFSDCSTLESVSIPYSVKKIWNHAFKNCTSLKEVTVPGSVDKMGLCVFSGCSSLEFVYIPPSVKEINSALFHGCSSLEHIYLSPTVKKIGMSAFSGCSSLKEISIPDSVKGIGAWAFKDCTSLVEIDISSSVEAIRYGAFEGCTSLKEITLPKKLRELETELFRGCSTLKKITIPESVKKIGRVVFSDCSSLTEVTIPSSVRIIEDYAFQNCESLTEITIPESVTEIGKEIFYGCHNLTKIYTSAFIMNTLKMYKEITVDKDGQPLTDTAVEEIFVEDGRTYISEKEFAYSKAKRIHLPPSIEFIYGEAFRGCKELEEITLPEYLRHIDACVFEECSSLRNIALPSGITRIPYASFRNCASLTEITIPNSVERIYHYAFSGCSKLTDITIPDSVKEIGEYAFSGCESLSSIFLPSSIEIIEECTFSRCCKLTDIIIPDSVKEIGRSAFDECGNLSSVTLSSSVEKIGSFAFNKCGKLTEIKIPDSVKKLGGWAFAECESLASVTLPSSVEKIGNEVFSGCSTLTEIIIPDSVKELGGWAFYDCASLEKAIIKGPIERIDDLLFMNCTSLTSVTIPSSVRFIGTCSFSYCSSLESIVLPESLEEIGERAFEDCESLEEIVMPDSVKKILFSAFEGCSALRSVKFPASLEVIYPGAFEDCESLEEIVIPKSVSAICEKAFLGCRSLKTLDIPKNVLQIEDGAFVGCTGLTSVRISANFKDDITRIFGDIDPSIIKFY